MRRGERVETRPPSGGGKTAALACGECGRDRDMDERQRRWRHSDGEAQQEDAAWRPEIETSEPTDREGQWLGGTEVARGELLHAAPGPGEQADQPQPRWESRGAPGEQRPEGGERAGSPRDGGSDRSGARHQGIGLSVTVVLLILLLVSILRTALNIAIRAIAVARARSCGWWLTGTLWGLLLQGVMALVQWTMAKRRTISGAAGRDMEDKEDRGGLTPAGTRLLIRSSPDRGSVLLHLDQHFIERESYRSGRERTLEISGRGWNSGHVIYPMCCVLTNKAPGPCNQLSLLSAKDGRSQQGIDSAIAETVSTALSKYRRPTTIKVATNLTRSCTLLLERGRRRNARMPTSFGGRRIYTSWGVTLFFPTCAEQYFCGSFLPSWILDPDPLTRLNPDPIRIRIRIRNPGSGWQTELFPTWELAEHCCYYVNTQFSHFFLVLCSSSVIFITKQSEGCLSFLIVSLSGQSNLAGRSIEMDPSIT
jgi:hypothetical protein